MTAVRSQHWPPLPAVPTRPDVLVIGAGPAGAVASLLLARAGRIVWLVDARPFPRYKVCGGCLNARSLATLDHLSLTSLLDEAEAAPLHRFHCFSGNENVQLALGPMVAVDRAKFDLALVRAAVAAGVRFLPQTTAQVLPEAENDGRRVLLVGEPGRVIVQAALVICADGLAHSSVRRLPGFTSRVERSSRIGLSTVLWDDSLSYPAGRLTMAVSRHGYVGLVRTANGALNVAAAVDPSSCGGERRPAGAIRRILQSCGLPAPAGLADARWNGTPTLSRRTRRVAGTRLFLLGDAAGYVEPFTGEGISFAMESAVRLAGLVLQATASWDDSYSACWERQVKKEVFAKQWTCRLLKRLLRSPALCRLAIKLCHAWPMIPDQVAARLNRLPKLLPTAGPPSA